MADRLAELQRQRALVQEHLAWLDREIALARNADAARPGAKEPVKSAPPFVIGVRSEPATPLVPVAPQSPVVTVGNTSVSAGPPPEAILEEYRVSSATLKNDVRKGCFLYFAGVLVVVAAMVAILYFALSRR